jgi:hypothetical protein
VTLILPRDLVFEAYLGRWVDITALAEGRSLRQADPVTIQWGAQSEQLGKVPPSTVEGVLNNKGGHWTQDNPMGDYWQYLQGRNVPTRLALRVERDTYSRTLPSTWGTTDTGGVWSLDGGNYAVGSGVGTHTVNAANTFQVCIIGDSYGDCLIVANWVSTSTGNITGGAIEPLNLVLRYQPVGPMTGRHYMLRLSVSTSEVLTATIFDSATGAISSTVGYGVVNPLAPNVRAKFQIEGQTMRGKVYGAGPANDPDQFEPLVWHLSANDRTLSGGFAGIRTGVASGNTNTPVTVGYDNMELRLARHTGELAKLQPSSDESHRIKKAAFKCADITQRLGRPERPALSSAPRRYLASNFEFTTTDFWPLDESPDAPAQGLNAVSSGQPAIFQRETGVVPVRGAVNWGLTDKVMTSVPAFVALNNGGRLVFPVNPGPLSLGWSVMWAMRLSPDAGAQVFFTTSTNNHFTLTLYTDGTYELFGNPGGTSLATGVFPPGQDGLDGRWVTFGLTIFFNGGSAIGFHLNVDGATLGTGNWPTGGYTALREILVHVPQPSTGGQGNSAFSSLFVTAAPFYTSLGSVSVGAKVSNVIKGWPGEKSGWRAFRLTAEEGVPFDYVGNLDDTRPMGPQRPIPLLDQLQECADADQAVLYPARCTPGLVLRTRRSMTAIEPTVALSYSGKQVAAPLAPAGDDRFTANLVRAERINGGFLILEQTSGPMNTKDPGTDAEAIGRSPAKAGPANLESDAQLGDLGGWMRALGTAPEIRYPRVTVVLAAPGLTTGVDPTLPARSLMLINVGDRLKITGMTAADVYRDLDQIVRGGREVFRNKRQHSVTFNTAPYEKYRAGVYGDSASRYDGAVTTLDAQLSSGVTGGRAVTTSAGRVWTTDAGAFPMDVLIGGERITLSGITGAGTAAQTMTISARAVNGVAKTHPAGTRVYLYQPVYHC